MYIHLTQKELIFDTFIKGSILWTQQINMKIAPLGQTFYMLA